MQIWLIFQLSWCIFCQIHAQKLQIEIWMRWLKLRPKRPNQVRPSCWTDEKYLVKQLLLPTVIVWCNNSEFTTVSVSSSLSNMMVWIFRAPELHPRTTDTWWLDLKSISQSEFHIGNPVKCIKILSFCRKKAEVCKIKNYPVFKIE